MFQFQIRRNISKISQLEAKNKLCFEPSQASKLFQIEKVFGTTSFSNFYLDFLEMWNFEMGCFGFELQYRRPTFENQRWNFL